MNTQLPIDKFTKSYGLDLQKQNELLNKMDYLITNMKVYGSNRRLPFQTGIFFNFKCEFHNNSTVYSFLGILVTNASIRHLLIDLKNDYEGIAYIMTRKVNSDVLENLFSYLKGMVGSNSHISPLEFKYWLKKIILNYFKLE